MKLPGGVGMRTAVSACAGLHNGGATWKHFSDLCGVP